MAVKIRLQNVRLAFPNLWHARKPDFAENDTEYFSATFLIEPGSENEKKVRAASAQAIADTFGDKAVKVGKEIADGGPDRNVLRNGDAKDKYDGFAGKLFVAAKNKSRPLVINKDKTPLVESDGLPYAGSFVDAVIEVYAYKNPRSGVTASLMGVQFRGDGEAFGGGKPATTDDFESHEAISDEDDLS